MLRYLIMPFVVRWLVDSQFIFWWLLVDSLKNWLTIRSSSSSGHEGFEWVGVCAVDVPLAAPWGATPPPHRRCSPLMGRNGPRNHPEGCRRSQATSSSSGWTGRRDDMTGIWCFWLILARVLWLFMLTVLVFCRMATDCSLQSCV